MTYLLGVDEAGYGPNLGPLVISATLWRVEDPAGAEGPATASEPREVDLYDVLAEILCATPNSRRAPGGRSGLAERIAIADSKTLYKPRGGLSLLERGLLPVLAALGHAVDDWRTLWQALGADPSGERDRLPWYRQFDLKLPTELSADERDELAARLSAWRRAAGAWPLAVRSRAVFPDELNALVERHGTKGAALSRVTIQLVADLLDSPRRSATEPTLVVCDKHGGRNRYGELLQGRFPDTLIEIHGESRARSVYRWGPPEGRIEWQFRVGGESFLPTALASMASKYLREIAMRAFNDYWRRQVAGLKPTAGYPVDARRFRRDIAERQIELKIADRVLWRSR